MYYKIPFNFGDVMDGQDAREVNIHESIAQHLQLLITTRFGENRYDEAYGNAVWELEFDKAMDGIRWKETFRFSVEEAIGKFEARLSESKVTIHTEIVEKTWPLKKFTEIKKKVTVLVTSILTDSGQRYTFKTVLYLSPMSVD